MNTGTTTSLNVMRRSALQIPDTDLRHEVARLDLQVVGDARVVGLPARPAASYCQPKRYRTERNRNVYGTTSSVQHGIWALKIEAMSKPKYRTVSKSNRSNWDLSWSGSSTRADSYLFRGEILTGQSEALELFDLGTKASCMESR